MRETEGSPDVRQRRRQRQMQLASQRMMAALEKADVVITNPDHYAVALRYDEARMKSPVVVAKGINETAQTIKRTARELAIPVAEIPPLARVLAQSLRVGEAIPPLLFESIAEVLAWAYRLRENPHDDTTHPDIEIDEEATLQVLKTKSRH
jgi:flagellar biosynthetic protein FlhB